MPKQLCSRLCRACPASTAPAGRGARASLRAAVAAATAAIAAATAAAVTAAAAAGTTTTRLGFVDAQRPTHQLSPLQGLNCLRLGCFISHFNKCKTALAPGIPFEG